MKGEETYMPDTDQWWLPVVVLFSMNTILYLIVQIFCNRDNSWIDASWGPQFCVTNIVIWLLRGTDEITPRMFLITVPVFIWGLRLAYYIAIRHTGEDYRYKAMREGWDASGKCGYYI
jgi:steroid 5-alpha reductase family enzyme